MKVEINLEATDPQGRSFIGWAPVKSTARLSSDGAPPAPIDITLRNGGKVNGGRVVFDTKRSDAGTDELHLSLPADGSEVEFWVAGEFQHPSTDLDDAAIEAVSTAGLVVGQRDLMVRIRKNAVKLAPAERDRFLVALGKLNDAGAGPFQSFRDTHVRPSQDEAHGYPGFPPWHRAYLLDLERSLQAIDPAVALPYWRFDEPAPGLFAPEFLGMPSANPAQGDIIQFPHGHPLEFWKTDPTHDPIERRPRYDIAVAPPQTINGQPSVIDQAATLARGGLYPNFRRLEGAPHGSAHTSFDGPISSVPTAAKDPLFFLLHANVDRLWAFWQWLNRRTDPSDPATYALTGPVRKPNNIGHRLNDTMWPWNGSTKPPRPTYAPPRGPFPPSPITSRPGGQPTVKDMIDYQGVHGTEPLGFDYDDVPFELNP
ncbi:tyrosinase family protein [Burkholderia sp. ABCPW 14]|uniref:tyrosinase family protein n=1 Tax=Burkholderia sp. ABCPW 14 TaxID=1637860 RepID=UPI000ACF0897|nr:tyrosinase family protein [Burkholderia sp. ABCPW 14]